MQLSGSDHGEDAFDFASPPAALAYLAALAMTAFAVVVGFALESAAAIPNLSLVFVMPVLLSAMVFGLGPSILAAVTGALAYNFFFVAPRFSFRVDDAANLWAVGLLLAIGVIASGVASRAARQRWALQRHERRLRALRRYAASLGSPAGERESEQSAADALADIFKVPVAVLALKDREVRETALNGARVTREEDLAAARLCLAQGVPTRVGTYPTQGSQFSFWPVTETLAIGLAFAIDDYPEEPSLFIEVVIRLLALQMKQKAM